jgi:GlpG protein
MRIIGYLEGEAQARTFSDYLLVQGIENDVEAEKDGTWAVWIRAEDELDRAKAELEAFRASPSDPKFKSTARVAVDVKEQKRREQAEYEKRLKQRRHLFRPLTGYGFGPVTYILIFICVGVFIVSRFGKDYSHLLSLYISEKDISNFAEASFLDAVKERFIHFQYLLPEIRQGEVWRLFTPIFMHFSVIHILFNMLWLRDLGSMIEGRQSSLLLLLLVLVIAAISNVSQYFWGGPDFGGMSGVVYGLFGYIWIRGKIDPGSGLIMDRRNSSMMIIWLIFCFTGLVGPIANGAHLSGMLVGMAWGWLSGLKYR